MPSKRKLNVIEIEHDGVTWWVCFSYSGKRVVCLRHEDPDSPKGWRDYDDPKDWRKPPLAALIAEAKRRQREPVAAR